MSTRPVGVIGLGAMGLGVARSLLRAGFHTHACDVRPEVLQQFEREGGVACANPAALGAVCEAVVIVVVNADQTEAAYQRSDLLERRRKLAEAWASYCSKPPGSGKVLPMRR